MHERVMAIVDLIAQYILGAKETPINQQELMAELVSAGFEADEINGAFAWMEGAALQSHHNTDQVPSSTLQHFPTYRIFSKQEEDNITTAARGFLLKVKAMGILSATAQEEVIDRALKAAGDAVNEQEIKLMTIITLLSQQNNPWLREIDCFLENDWDRIYN